MPPATCTVAPLSPLSDHSRICHHPPSRAAALYCGACPLFCPVNIFVRYILSVRKILTGQSYFCVSVRMLARAAAAVNVYARECECVYVRACVCVYVCVCVCVFV